MGRDIVRVMTKGEVMMRRLEWGSEDVGRFGEERARLQVEERGRVMIGKEFSSPISLMYDCVNLDFLNSG